MLRIISRLLLGMLALALLGAGLALLLAPAAVLAGLEIGLAGVRDMVAVDASRQAAGVIATSVGLVLLLLGVWPQGSTRSVRSRVEGAVVEYATDAVEELVAREVVAIDGVAAARVHLRGHRRGQQVVVQADVTVADGYDPQAVVAAAAARLRDRLQQGFRLDVADVRLTVRPPSAGPAGRRAEATGAADSHANGGAPLVTPHW